MALILVMLMGDCTSVKGLASMSAPVDHILFDLGERHRIAPPSIGFRWVRFARIPNSVTVVPDWADIA